MNWEQLQERASRAISKLNIRYADVRLERTDSTSVRFRGRRLDTAGRNFDAGGIARVLLADGGWGIASFNSFDELEERISLAKSCAAVQAGGERTELAPVAPAVDSFVQPVGVDFRAVPLADKVALMRAHNDRLVGTDPRIVDTMVAYSDSYSEKLLVTSEGTAVRQSIPYCQVMVMAVARSGDNIQRAFDSSGDTSTGYELARAADAQVEAVGRRAVDLLAAPKVKSGRYPVVLDPKLAGVFIHEAFGHLSEADHVCENAQARQMMDLGRPFAPEFFNVYDDPTIAGQWGSHRYDDEGVRSKSVPLITAGRLTGRLHSRYTAALMGEQPTGSGYAINYQHAPVVRMSNTYIAPGQATFDELIGGIKEGVYACGMFGGQTMLENFSFSAAYGRMIRNGQLAEMVRDVVVAGNLFQTMKDISGMGDDLKLFGGGGCGKAGQSPFPVGLGSPHLRIENVLIGGE
ncbi:MAG: TldD/PmbA family protein [Phycisphaerae bacterium]|nr:TldD/PmbA family protein [Phycisphaerae bacterium]